MLPETKRALSEARAAKDQDQIAVVVRYVEDGWDHAGYPWPGPGWMRGRYATWAAYRDYLVTLSTRSRTYE